jgi:adenosylcobinamide kinase/adenosylcobinamide-phosphate guanylyltransferase
LQENLPKLTLVLGGASSGKSKYAETLCSIEGLQKVYVATAQVFDDEMSDKIAKHLIQRGPNWITIEAPIDVAGALAQAPDDAVILIDCATLWLTNVILGDHNLVAATEALLAGIAQCPHPIVIVSNEVGYGIVPENVLSRRFRHAQGALNQTLATHADRVVAVMAGLPLTLKGDQ